MTVSTQQERVTRQERVAFPLASWLRGWRPVTAVITLAGGAAVITGAFLPWVEAFAGLIPIPGVRGDNGKILAAAGAVIVAAGLWQLVTGSQAARWLGGLFGFAAAAFAGHLLLQLHSSMQALGGDAMFAVRSGPGLAVTTAGALVAFATLLLPPSSQTTLRRVRPAADTTTDTTTDTGTGPTASAPALTGSAADATPRTARLPTVAALRRGLQIALGVIWLLDAALQYQPVMFSKMFATMMLAPSAAGQPLFVAGPVHLTVRIVAASPVAWNAVFATVQLALGVGLLFRRTTRAALAGTIAWGLAVWWLGEGLGGIFTAAATPLTGAPGGAVLYALLAVLAWPGVTAARRPGRAAAATPAGLVSVAESGPLGRYAKLAWFVLWAALAVFTVHAPLQASTLTAAGGTPAHVITALVTAACCVAALGVLAPATTRLALLTAAAAGAIIWAAGEDYGAISSGMATDPNTGPLLLLLAMTYWPVRPESATPVMLPDVV
jgi:hypothetical protein